MLKQIAIFEQKYKKNPRFRHQRQKNLPEWYKRKEVIVHKKKRDRKRWDICDDQEMYDEVQEVINRTFGTFGNFAAYNRNCALFGYRIMATLPSKEELVKLEAERREVRKAEYRIIRDMCKA
jgi:hypothetical protein